MYLHTAAFVIKGRFLIAASSAASVSVLVEVGLPASLLSALEAVVSDGTAPSGTETWSSIDEEFLGKNKTFF